VQFTPEQPAQDLTERFRPAFTGIADGMASLEGWGQKIVRHLINGSSRTAEQRYGSYTRVLGEKAHTRGFTGSAVSVHAVSGVLLG